MKKRLTAEGAETAETAEKKTPRILGELCVLCGKPPHCFALSSGLLASERGIALIVSMMAMLLMTALGSALVVMTTIEAKIAKNYRNHSESLYAADAALERAVDELRAIPDWNTLLSGAATSAFVDGPPAGPRTLADAATLDIGAALNMANCAKATGCSAADMDAVTLDRPWGPNNPRWQVFAYGRLSDMAPGAMAHSPFYVLVMVGDDPSENDSAPLVDGVSPGNPGSGVLAMRAEAWGPSGAHNVLELTLARADSTGPGPASLRLLSWREIR